MEISIFINKETGEICQYICEGIDDVSDPLYRPYCVQAMDNTGHFLMRSREFFEDYELLDSFEEREPEKGVLTGGINIVEVPASKEYPNYLNIIGVLAGVATFIYGAYLIAERIQ